MHLFICYIKHNLTCEETTKVINKVFALKNTSVASLLDDRECEIRYEWNELDKEAEFSYELIVYTQNKEILINSGIYNNLLFGLKLHDFIQASIIINDETDDPYQWLLIKNKKLYLVEEEFPENNGINLLEKTNCELSIEKSLELLPDKDFIISNSSNSKTAYYVKPSSEWSKCELKEPE